MVICVFFCFFFVFLFFFFFNDTATTEIYTLSLHDALPIWKYGLWFSDALHSACCKVNDITDIATNDRDFERVDFLKVWKP